MQKLLIIFLLAALNQQLYPRLADRVIEHRNEILANAESVIYKDGVWIGADKEIPYKLGMVIIRPENMQESETYPAMIMVHGGGFAIGSPEQFLIQAHFFSKLGFVCFLPEYRLRNPGESDQHLAVPNITIQEQLADIKRAVRWVRQHAATYQVDSERLVGWGGSAGGYLISAAGMVHLPDAYMEYQPDESRPYESSRLGAQILVNPAVDLTFYFKQGYDRWLSRDLSSTPEALSPAFNITEETPPTLLLNGSEDTVTPPFMVEDFWRKMGLIGQGERCEEIVYEGATHGFANRDPALDSTMKQAATFLRRYGMTAESHDPLFDASSYAYRNQNESGHNYSNFVQVLTPLGYSASRSASYPAAVFLYEGPLVNGALCENDYYEMAELAKRLVLEKGVVAFVPDFRIPYISRVPYDQSIKDVRAAFRWIKEHAEMFNIDPSELVAVGAGYGAHLALATTLDDEAYDHSDDNSLISPAPAKFVLLNPILDLNAVRENEEMIVHSNGFNYWAGGSGIIIDSDFTDLSAILQPVWIIEGLADPTYRHRYKGINADESYPEATAHFYSETPYIDSVSKLIFKAISSSN